MFHTFHVELSSFCNAACPGCRRTSEVLKPNFVKQHLNVISLFDLDKSFYKDLKKIQVCGNIGDPILHPKFVEIISFFLDSFDGQIEISTNGEPHNNKWWTALGKQLNNRGHVIFGIDGLADTHSIYRVGTDWQTIIDNATAFVNAGGEAHWQFIPFAHNEHQILKAIKLSQELKFKKFFLKEERNPPKGMSVWSKSKLDNPRTGTKKENCLYTTGTIFMAADGQFTPCCYLGDKPVLRSDKIESFHSKLELLWQNEDTTPDECKIFCHRNISV
jgi:MoaA/NifB/PqqE/SkfB family radical SAM enzyme